MPSYNTSFMSDFFFICLFSLCAVGMVILVTRRLSLLEGQSFSFTFHVLLSLLLFCTFLTTLLYCSHNFSVCFQFFCLLHVDVILYALTVFCFISRNETFWQGHHVCHARKLRSLSVWEDVISLIFPILMVERFLLVFLDNLLFNST